MSPWATCDDDTVGERLHSRLGQVDRDRRERLGVVRQASERAATEVLAVRAREPASSPSQPPSCWQATWNVAVSPLISRLHAYAEEVRLHDLASLDRVDACSTREIAWPEATHGGLRH